MKPDVLAGPCPLTLFEEVPRICTHVMRECAVSALPGRKPSFVHPDASMPAGANGLYHAGNRGTE